MPHTNDVARREYQQSWYLENRARLLVKAKQRGPEKPRFRAWATRHAVSFWSKLKCRYGLSREDFSVMLGTQMTCCKICGRRLHPQTSDCCVDHDHVTGKVRGLLCPHCNKGLGQFGDDPILLRKAAEYVTTARA